MPSDPFNINTEQKSPTDIFVDDSNFQDIMIELPKVGIEYIACVKPSTLPLLRLLYTVFLHQATTTPHDIGSLDLGSKARKLCGCSPDLQKPFLQRRMQASG